MAEQTGHECGVAENGLCEPTRIDLRTGFQPAPITERGWNAELARRIPKRARRLAGVRITSECERRCHGHARPDPRSQLRRQRDGRRHGTLRLDTDVLTEQRSALLTDQATDRVGIAVVSKIARR